MITSLMNSLHVVLNQKLFESTTLIKCDQECQTDTLTIPLLCRIKTYPKLEYTIDIDERSKGCQTNISDDPICVRQSVKRKELHNESTTLLKPVFIPTALPLVSKETQLPKIEVYHPLIDPSKGKINQNQLRKLRMTSVIDAFEEAGLIEGLDLIELQNKYACEFDDEPIAQSGICKLLRSKQFGISRNNKVIKFKRNF